MHRVLCGVLCACIVALGPIVVMADPPTLPDSVDSRLHNHRWAHPRPLTKATVRRLRDRFGVPPRASRIVLVGKDGTEKHRDADLIPARSHFDTIDAMPMRQREMREEGGGE